MAASTISFKRRIGPLVENVAESTAACLTTMVQGNLLALGVEHWLIASQTGLIAGTIATAAILVARIRRIAAISLILGVVTAVVDFVIHGALLPVISEAIVTGIGAALLSSLVAVSLRYLRTDRSAAR